MARKRPELNLAPAPLASRDTDSHPVGRASLLRGHGRGLRQVLAADSGCAMKVPMIIGRPEPASRGRYGRDPSQWT
ncbi:hypothetical protein GCM10022236_44110 [Microlunatus ginsengisoli]|uniref:Uncharacterized protein n=1 Tax=Microlunatus ginsengisoli TaxID=363863 RepID=A0ABP7AND4_9ACTN